MCARAVALFKFSYISSAVVGFSLLFGQFFSVVILFLSIITNFNLTSSLKTFCFMSTIFFPLILFMKNNLTIKDIKEDIKQKYSSNNNNNNNFSDEPITLNYLNDNIFKENEQKVKINNLELLKIDLLPNKSKEDILNSYSGDKKDIPSSVKTGLSEIDRPLN